jgi:CubicO group peptidase (beta-lactamase class C family)
MLLIGDQEIGRVDDLFIGFDLPHSPGLYLTLIREGEIVFQKGYGRAECDHDVAWSQKTRCRIASITKQMIALLLVERAKKGDFSLDDPIGLLLPELPAHAAGVTIDQCLLHQSGLSSDEPLADLAGSPFAAHVSLDYLHNLICRQPQAETPPGSFVYNDAGYRLLVRWLEARYGASCDSLLKKYLFEPMGMATASMTGDERKMLPFDAHMYFTGADGSLEHWFWGRTSSGDGGVSLTKEDMVLWYNNVLRNPERIALLLPKRALGDCQFVGRGQFQGQHRGHRWIGHTGMGGCGLFHFPDDDFGVLFFGNHPDLMRHSLPFRVFDAVFESTQLPLSLPLAPVLSGHNALKQNPNWTFYTAADGDLLHCARMEGGLIAKHFDQYAYLTAQSDGSLNAEDGTFQIQIMPTSSDALHVKFGLNEAKQFTPAPEGMEGTDRPMAGIYYSHHTGSTLEIIHNHANDLILALAGGMSADMIIRLSYIRPGLWFDKVRISLRWTDDDPDKLCIATTTASYLVYKRIA